VGAFMVMYTCIYPGSYGFMAMSFAKTQRLLTKSQFDAVLNGGTKVVCRDFVLVAAKRAPMNSETPEARLGLIVSRKVGGAVQRNRIKRCVRECFRTDLPHSLSGKDLVVIARPTLATDDGKVTRDVQNSFLRCLSRLDRTLSQKSSIPTGEG